MNESYFFRKMNIANIFGCHHCIKNIFSKFYIPFFINKKTRQVSIIKYSVEPHTIQNTVICTNVRLEKAIVTYANTRSTLKPYWNPKPYTICPKCICKQLREMNKLILKSNQMATFFFQSARKTFMSAATETFPFNI